MQRTVLSVPERTEGGAGVETVGHVREAALQRGGGRPDLRVKPAERAGVRLCCDRRPLITAKPATSGRVTAAISCEPSQVNSFPHHCV